MRNFDLEFMTAPNIQHVTQLVSQDWRMWYEFVSFPMTHAARSTTRAFTTAGGTLQHCANLSVAAFAVHPNVWAAWLCAIVCINLSLSLVLLFVIVNVGAVVCGCCRVCGWFALQLLTQPFDSDSSCNHCWQLSAQRAAAHPSKFQY